MDLAGLIPWIALWAMVFGPLTSWYARQRARQPLVWLVYGTIIGPVAALILASAPPGRCPICDEPVSGWASHCPSCGTAYERPLQRWLEGPAAVAHKALVTSPATLPHTPARRTPARRTLAAESNSARAAASPAVSNVQERPGDAVSAAGDELQTALVATGVLLPGRHRLRAGLRYLLARHGHLLWVLGPIETTPSKVRFERSIEGLSVTARTGHLLVSRRGHEQDGPALAFAAVDSLDAAAAARLSADEAGPGLGPSVTDPRRVPAQPR